MPVNEFSQKRIFLTGGTGLFGKWLLEHFQGLETEVVVLSRNPDQFLQQFPMFGPGRRERGPALAGQRPEEGAKNRNPTFIQGDVRDFKFPAGQFDYVIHAATEVGAKLERENPNEMYSVIVDGTKRIIEFSEHAGVRRLLYVSSGAVYGVQPPELSHIPETFPCNPVTPYGKSKLKAEQMCLESGIETVIARPFAFVGPWLPLNARFAVGNFIGNCLRNEPIEIEGDGTPLRSYMHASDLVRWLLTILLKGRIGDAYNVGSAEAISIKDLAWLVRSVAGTDNEIRIREQPIPGTAPTRYVPSIEKAEKQLGLSVLVSLPDALTRTIQTIRKYGI